MSFKIGIPILKAMSSGRYSAGGTHINAAVAAWEALADESGTRHCSDPDYRPELTKDNLILYGCRTPREAQAERKRRIEEYNSTAKRKIRSDSPTGCCGIIKPDKELMERMTKEQQIELLKRAFAENLDIMGKTPANVIYAVIHVDEGNLHLHYELDGRLPDGRWSATPMFQLKTKSALNEILPRNLNLKYGYHIEPCRNPEPRKKGSGKKQTLTAPEYKKAQELKREIAENEKKIEQQQAEILTQLPANEIHRLILLFLKWLEKNLPFPLPVEPQFLADKYMQDLERQQPQRSRNPWEQHR